MSLRHTVATTLIGIGLAATLSTPAQAVVLDASGVEFNFANPGGVDRLANVTTGDNFLYTNVATIGGTQVDALVTVGQVSQDAVSDDIYVYFNAFAVAYNNGLNPEPEADLEVGCYTNEAYRQDYLNETTLFPFEDFVASDRLPGGYVDVVDEFEDDERDPGLSSELTVCTYFDDPSDATSFSITVAFQVAGNPVTLDNLIVSAEDIDGGQHIKFTSPKPTSYELTENSQLVLTEDASFLRFSGEDPADDDPDYAVDVQFDGVSTFTYEFGVPAGDYGGSFNLMFESFFNPNEEEPLANTGSDSSASSVIPILGLAILLAGFAVGRARVRR